MVSEIEKPDKEAEFYFSGHAIQRMFARKIAETDIITVIRNGEIIARYPDDKPFPSCLLLGKAGSLPLHVVYALEQTGMRCHVITAYIPDRTVWEDDFRTRRVKP